MTSMMVREELGFTMVGCHSSLPSRSFRWPSRIIARFPGNRSGGILVVFLFSLFLMTTSANADTTLEILNLVFPENCGATVDQDLTSCTQCHVRPSLEKETRTTPGGLKDLSLNYRTLTSLEETGRITVDIPAETLEPGQPFHQTIHFRGNRIFYQYGYRKDGGVSHILDSRWILDAPGDLYPMNHDGKSLPVLKKPGEYIFALKLLHEHLDGPHGNDSRWEETILLWTLNVNDKN